MNSSYGNSPSKAVCFGNGNETVWTQATFYEETVRKNYKILLIISPRHIQRANKISKINNLNIKIKSKDGLPSSKDNFWISNTYGEMSSLYSLADIVFVGGSLYPYGGHNPSEPCHYETKIIMGPHSEKCQEVVKEMKDNNCNNRCHK